MKENLHYILEEDGRSVTVENGVVTAISTPTPLTNTPKGWQDIIINCERSLTWYGVIRSFTTPLAYVLKAAQIIRHTVYTQNIERKLLHLIQRLTSEVTSLTYRLVYRYLYRGEIDLSTFKDEESYVTCAIMEGGLSKKLNANKDTVYELRMAEDPDIKYLFLDGIIFDQSAKLIMPDITSEIRQYIMPVSFISADQASSNSVAFFTSQYTQYFGGPTYNFAPSSNYFLKTVKAVTVRIAGRIQVTSAGSYSFWIVGSSNQAIDPTNYPAEPGLYYVQPAVGAGSHTFDFDVTLDLPAGETLFFYATHPFDSEDVYALTDIVVTFQFRHDPSTIRFFLPETAGKKLTAKFTGSEDDFESPLLQAKANYGLTCGDAIRGLDTARIKTSLSEFFADYNITCFAGLAVDSGKIRMESRSIYFDEANPVDLGAAKDLEVNLALDIMGNTIKAGHTKPDIEDVNGKFDPNGSSVYTTPVTKIAKEINLVGPYKKGPYEIEITRINLEGKTTTDNSNDNDCFVIDVKEMPPVTTIGTFTAAGSFLAIPQAIEIPIGMRITISGSTLNDSEFTVLAVSNIPPFNVLTLSGTLQNEVSAPITIVFPYILNRDPIVDNDIDVCPSPETIFNVRFTPKNILKLHGRWLRSLLYGFDSEKIKFQSGDKNTKFLATVDGVIMDEDSDEDIYSLGDLLFKPFYFDFTTEVPSDLVAILEAGLNRCFSFTWDGNTYTGFLIKASQAVNTEQAQKFRLLSAPSNNLLNLVV